MSNLFETVKGILEEDKRFLSTDGTIMRNAVYEAAMKMDSRLIKALYTNDETREHLFTDVDGIAVFDKVGFGWVINNREFLPDSFTRYKNKIGLIDSKNDFISARNDVVLSFPYKDCILEMDSTNEDENRKELFFNSTLLSDDIDRLLYPKVFSNAHKYFKGQEVSVATIASEDNNIIIKGNNLLALYSLRKKYSNRIKLMYWDILYNTQNDKVPYNDRFKHSSWLVMMKNRLEAAKPLLLDSGVICMQCDDNEMAYLKVLCDEVFGRENYIGSIIVKMSTVSGVKTSHRDKTIIKEKETILVYCKNASMCKIKPQYIPTYEWDSEFQYYLEKNGSDNPDDWIVLSLKDVLKNNGLPEIVELSNPDTREFIERNINSIWRRAFIRNEFKAKSQEEPNKIFINESDGKCHYYYRGREMFFLCDKLHECFTEEGYKTTTSNLIGDIWLDINTGKLFSEGGVELRNGKKPEFLIARLIDMFTQENDIVLDAFLGSGTTTAVAHKMNRKYVGVEQLDTHISLAVNRMKKVVDGDQSGVSIATHWQGGGSFVYCELAEMNQKYVNQIKNVEDEKTLLSIWKDIKRTGFVSCYVNPADIDENASDFKDLSFDDKKRLFLELLDLNQLYVNYCDIDDETFGISDVDKAFTRSFYGDN